MGTSSLSTDNRTSIEVLKDNLDDAHFRIQGLEEELAEKRKEIKSLERKLTRLETEGVKAGTAESLFDLWVALNRKRSSTMLTPDRRKAINAAVKLYGEADVRKVIAQNAHTPFLVYGDWRASGQYRPDLADVLSKGKHFDSLRELANKGPEHPFTEERMAELHTLLLSTEAVLKRVHELKAWGVETLESLGVGYDKERLVFPIRDADGALVGVTRYFPGERTGDTPKAIAVGQRGFFPPPESIDGDTIWLVEGEPDAVTAHEMWLPGVAAPGASVRPGDWMRRFKGRRVVICFDCDDAGRSAAKRIAHPLTQYATEVRVIDLNPERNDGYDLTDWFRQGRSRRLLEDMAKKAKPVTRQVQTLLPQQKSFDQDPSEWGALFDDFVRALEQRDLRPKELRGGQWIALCPVHDDHNPTLHFRLGEKTPVAAHCKTGCPWPDIKEALQWPRKEQ